jgi:Holliday junction resolvase RusA-like endonuclease
VIEFFVHGTAVPQGSKRAIGGNVIEMGGKRLKDWRLMCASACQAKMDGQGLLLGPVSVRAVFWIQRPKGHWRTGRNAHLLRDGLPLAPQTSPDIDKLGRSLLDSLTAVAFRDDGQVARLWLEKQWADPQPGAVGVSVSIWEID